MKIFFLLFGLIGTRLMAQMVIADPQLHYNPVLHSSFLFSDSTDIRQIQHKSFSPISSTMLSFGNNKKTLWLKFSLANKTNEPLTLEIGKPHMSSVHFYEPVSDTFIVHKGGSHISINQKDYRHNRLWFRIPAFAGIKTFYIKIESPNKTAPIHIASEKIMFEQKSHDDMFFGISFGILFMVLFYTLFVYFNGRDPVYLLYMAYIFFVNLSSAILVGYTPGILTNDTFNIGHYTHIVMALSAISLTLFSARFLEIKKYTPAFMWIVYVFLALECSTIVLSLLHDDYLGSILIQVFTAGSAFLLLPVSIFIYQIGLKSIRFYILAWIVGWGFIVSYLMAINGMIPANFYTLNGVLFGSIFESILFSVALADKIKIIKVQTEKANQKVLEMLKENERLFIEQKEALSQQVVDRTSELAAKNTELEKYSKGLEALVLERAREIIKMNDELQQQNHRLEQYTFVATHNIRGPVARILGLLYLLRIEDKRDEEKIGEIIYRLEKSTHELDSIVKDLSFLLTLDRDIEKGSENINIRELLENVLNALEVDIEDENSLFLDIQVNQLMSSRPLLYSILYNVLSNSWKFRSPERALKINFKTKEDHRHFYLIISDNGMGMEVDKFKRKIFSPYQRFHPDIEGKGIGLFMVKTQVEALGGMLELDSIAGDGTMVKITLIK